MTLTFLTVEPHMVEHGDLLAGQPNCTRCGQAPTVDSILFNASGDGTWLYYCTGGHVIGEAARLARVQVLRDTRSPFGVPAGQVGEEGPPSRALLPIDNCPPHGIARRLFAVVP